MDNMKIEQIVLQDGRRAERHTFVDTEGKEVVEIFAEELRPLKLEKRISRESKSYVARETEETVQDGTVVEKKVKENPQPEIKVTEHIGVADHAKLVAGDYIRRDEIGKLITDSVVAGVGALIEPKGLRDVSAKPEVATRPKVSAQAVVEQNVEDKKSKQLWVDLGLGALIVAQVVFFIYYVLVIM